MAANGISTLATKEERQEAKLDLAQTQRQAGGDTTAPRYRQNNTYDINALPTKYSGNTVVDNANTGGLVQGRPWINIAGIQWILYAVVNPPKQMDMKNPTHVDVHNVQLIKSPKNFDFDLIHNL